MPRLSIFSLQLGLRPRKFPRRIEKEDFSHTCTYTFGVAIRIYVAPSIPPFPSFQLHLSFRRASSSLQSDPIEGPFVIHTLVVVFVSLPLSTN